MHLDPWNTPTGAITDGELVAGAIHGEIIYAWDALGVFILEDAIVDDIYEFNAVFKFENESLLSLFGDGLSAWSSGALIATYGNNEMWFTTVIPEPSIAVLLIGAGVGALALRRKRLHSIPC